MSPKPCSTDHDPGNAAGAFPAPPATLPHPAQPVAPQALQHGGRRRHQFGESEQGHPRQFGEWECGPR